MRVIDAEHPHLRATQIDVTTTAPSRTQLPRNCSAAPKKTRPRGATASGTPRGCARVRLRPDERRTTVVEHEHDGMRLQIRTPGDLQTMELVAFDRVPPGPGADRGRGHRVQHQLRRRSRRVRPVPDLRRPAAAVGHRFRRRRDRGRAGRHRAPGRRPRRRHVPERLLEHLRHLRRRLAVTLPAGLSDDQAAAVPTAYATAWYGLHDLARISSGDKVLIHSATGRRRTGGDRDRPRRRCRDLRHRGQPEASRTVARHGYRARLRLAQHRVRRPDPP